MGIIPQNIYACEWKKKRRPVNIKFKEGLEYRDAVKSRAHKTGMTQWMWCSNRLDDGYILILRLCGFSSTQALYLSTDKFAPPCRYATYKHVFHVTLEQPGWMSAHIGLINPRRRRGLIMEVCKHSRWHAGLYKYSSKTGYFALQSQNCCCSRTKNFSYY